MKHIIKIKKIIVGGKGLARPDSGKVIMAGFVLPGEIVRIREIKELPGYIEGELIEVIEPAATRIEPGCDYYGECGGCDLQHGEYPEQLKIKKAIVREALVRTRVLSDEIVQDVVPSPDQWGYRCRLRLQIDKDGQPGFFRKKSNSFIAINTCPVATAAINTALAELDSTRCLKELAANCDEVELLQSPADQKITLVLLLKGSYKAPGEIIQAISECDHINYISCKTGKDFFYLQRQIDPDTDTATDPPPLSQTIPLPDHTCTLSWSGGCFSQVNAAQNEQLIQIVCDLAGDLTSKTVLDLFCGMGNFSIPLAMQGGTVTGIEWNRESIKWAKLNAETAGILCNFFAADVNKSLHQLLSDQQQVDIIILDPPRKGIGKAARLLPKLQPERIIYISCDPATLARDLVILCNRGYNLAKLIPVDMFPQTHHIESVALLEKT